MAHGESLHLDLKPSRRLVAGLLSAHAVGAILLLPLTLPLWAKLAGIAGLSASLAYYLLSDGLRRLPRSVVGLVLRRDRDEGLSCEIRLGNGQRFPGRVLGTTLVVPALVVLRVRAEALRLPRTVVVPGDALEPEDLRTLRVMLRWGFRAAQP